MSSDAIRIRDAMPRYSTGTDTQDVPEGYERTAVGVIPGDWEIARLGALGQALSGGTPSKSNARLWGGDIPWVSSKDMKVIRIRDSIDHVTSLAVGNGTRLVQPGTILMVVRGMSLAHSFPVAIVTAPVSFNQDIKAFVPHRGVIGEFLLRWLEASQARILLLATEATHGTKRIPTDDLLGSMIPLPRPAEQRAIAEALSDVDGLLGALEALIAKRRAIKQATMQQLLTGKTRLPGFSEEWETKLIGEFGATYGGLTGKSKTDFGTGQARYVTFLNVLNNVVIDPQGFEPVRVIPGEPQNRVRMGDTLFNGTSETPGDLAMAAVAGTDEDDLFLNSFCFGFRIYKQTEYLPRFLAYYFRGSPGRKIMYALAQGATRYNMSKSQFKNLELSLPQYDEQKAIAAVLADMDAEIAALEARRDKTRAIKQGMMQQLLTGRVRLVEPAEAA